MGMSDQLLQLLVQLQGNTSVVYGRRILLDYMCNRSGARLASIFTLDRERQLLMPLAYVGQLPPGLLKKNALSCAAISISGLFGCARSMSVSDLSTNVQALAEERAWSWSGGSVRIEPISTASDEQGVLVLSFFPEERKADREEEGERDIQICLSLLGSYLSRADMPEKMYSLEQQEAINDERRRMGRELHDGPVQSITSVLHKLELAQHLIEKKLLERALAEVRHSYTILQTCLRDLRHDISSLVPARLEEQGFARGLQDLLEEVRASEPHLSIFYDASTVPPPALEGPVFRFIQEALNNVRKHACATEVFISIRAVPALLLIQVSDNGIGLQQFSSENTGVGEIQGTGTTKSSRQMGLCMMRERVQEAGGSWEISSSPGKGTTIKARFPLASDGVSLTLREREVLRLLVEGLTNRDIAQRLSVSTETVKSHVRHIMQKMHVKDRTQAAVLATKRRLVS